MEVVYKSLIDEIVDAHMKAQLSGRTIKHIKLTFSEYQEVKFGLFGHMDRWGASKQATGTSLGMVDGITLVKGW